MDELLTRLKNDIENLDTDKHKSIFEIFKKHEVQYSKNSNGIFINLSEINQSIIKDIQEHVKYYKKQEKMLEKFEEEKESAKKMLQNNE